MRVFLFMIFVVVVVAGVAAAFVWYGLFDVSARVPHAAITLDLIEAVRDRSIVVHSRNVKVPSLDNPDLAARGASLFHEECRDCHGAPGVAAESFAQGLYPAPADLLSGDVQKEWKDKQLFWIVENGLKMTGMPAFGSTLSRDELYNVVAFLRRLPGTTPEQYKLLIGGSAGGRAENRPAGTGPAVQTQ